MTFMLPNPVDLFILNTLENPTALTVFLTPFSPAFLLPTQILLLILFLLWNFSKTHKSRENIIINPNTPST